MTEHKVTRPRIDSFTGQFAFLSNFYFSPIVIRGWAGASAEHLYQAMKSVHPEDQAAILSAPTPAQAKRLGRSVPLRPDWDQVKRRIMYRSVFEKFVQNPALGQLLYATAPLYLEEGNSWGDTYWGTVNGEGDNWLGTILMSVRDLYVKGILP